MLSRTGLYVSCYEVFGRQRRAVYNCGLLVEKSVCSVAVKAPGQSSG